MKPASTRGRNILPQDTISGVSLTTRDFKWLHQEVWEAPAIFAYETLRNDEAPVGLFAQPAFSRRKKSPSQLVHAGRWVLFGPEDQVLAAAEAQMIATNFRTVWLFVGSHKASWADKVAQVQLSLLISGLLLKSRADRFLLASWNLGNDKDLLNYSPTGESKIIWTPFQSLRRLQGSDDARKIQSAVIDPSAWWLSNQGAADRQQLSYLERRAAAYDDKPGSKKNPPRRRSVFRPWGK